MPSYPEKPKINSIQIAVVALGLITVSALFCINENNIPQNKETPIFKLAPSELNEQNSCKIVYLTETQNCNGNCKNDSWNKWSHSVFKTAMNAAYPQISCEVAMGSTYDFEFDINDNKQISNISVTHRFGDDDSAQLLTDNITNNLFILKDSIKKLNNSQVLTYPQNEKRIKTKVLGAIQIVDNTIFVHVIQTESP